MAKKRKHHRKAASGRDCAGRKANGAIKKGYKLVKGRPCPVKA